MKNIFQKNILNPIVDLLKQGLTPEKLALSLCAGIAISCFPVLGSTTILCALFAHFFKVNHIAIQIANYVCYPLQFALLIPFFLMGNYIFGYEKMIFNIQDMLTHFQIDTVGFFQTYTGLALRACVAWLISAPIIGLATYYPLKILVQRISKKQAASMVILIFFTSIANAEIFKFTGTAKNTKGEVVYTEKHKVILDNNKVISSETLYYSHEDKLIAELKSDYKTSMFLPEYIFKDLRSGIEHIVVKDGDKLLLKSKENEKSNIKTKIIKASEKMVSCQGFHYFIRENLDKFKRNEDKDIQLILPGLLDYFTFNIRAQDKKQTEGPIVNLKMTVNSWVLKMFVQTVDIEYDTIKKQLLKYRGASNILTDSGKTQDVEITYQY
ncbi:MAG: DUF2062 domain-containing protein [Bdellovibrionota bacterium]